MFLFVIFTDDDLILFKNRDPDILEKVFKEYNEKLFNYLIIKVNGNIHLAEELFSDTFHDAIISASRLKDINKVYSWLIQIANRRFIDNLRKKYRNKKYESDSEIDDNYSIKEDLSNKLIDNEKKLMMKQALEEINPEYKKLLILKHIDNKSQKEISEIMGKTESSIESLLVRARKALKKELKNLSKVFL